METSGLLAVWNVHNRHMSTLFDSVFDWAAATGFGRKRGWQRSEPMRLASAASYRLSLLRFFSSVAAPMPLTSSSSSTDWNGPWLSR